MAKQTMLSQMALGAQRTDWGNVIPSITNFLRELFVQMGGALSILTLMGIDMILGGVSMYFMFDGVPMVPPTLLAMMFSVGLSAVSYRLWLMVRKGTKWDLPILGLILVITPLDLWVDLAFMEIVYGTGDVWWFLSRQAFDAVPRPPLWWGFLVLIGIITLVNEPLTAILSEAMKKKAGYKQRYSTKRTPQPSRSSAQRKPVSKSNNRKYNPVSAPPPPLNTPKPVNMAGMDDKQIQELFGGKL